MDNPSSGSSYQIDEGKDRDDNDDSAPPDAKRVRKTDDDDKDGPPPDVLSTLPDEVLLQILSHLGSLDLARGVCGISRRFRGICGDVTLQKRLGVLVLRDGDARVALEKVDAFKNLEELVVSGLRLGVQVAIRALERCPRLGAIEIDSSQNERMDPNLLVRTIGSSGKSLRVLKMNTPILMSGFRGYNIKFLKDLTHLELNSVTKSQLRTIVDCCKKLKHFYFRRCRGYLNDDDMNYYLEGLKDSLEEISIDERFKSNSVANVSKCEKLTKVRMTLRDIHYNRKALVGEMLKSIVQLPVLKELEIYYSEGYPKGWLRTADLVGAFAAGEKSIEVLSLRRFPKMLNSRALAAISDACCNSLTSLTLSGCAGVTSHGLGRILHECIKLVDLHLLGCRISSKAFMDVRAPLTSLHCASVEMDDDSGVLAALADACCNSLTRLTLSSCVGITDEGVGKILQKCERLVNLHLGGCCKVSSEAFKDVRAPLKYLQFGYFVMDPEEVETIKERLGIST